MVYSIVWHRRTVVALLFGWLLCMTQGGIAMGEGERDAQGRLQLQVVYNNVPYQTGLTPGWGFSCLIEGLDRSVLFDTGGDGDILLSNMQRLGIDPGAIDVLVLSHNHSDHTGGVDALLAQNPGINVYLPESVPASFRHALTSRGAVTQSVTVPRQLLPGVYTTGEMGWGVEEQALIVDSREGEIVITGCAHPNVADMVERAKAYRGRDIHLLLGGFHLGGSSDEEIAAIIARLKALGVKKVAPSHCTGDRAIQLFREAWGEDFVEGGLGAVIVLPR